MAVAQHRADHRVVAELGAQPRERLVARAQIAARLVGEQRELLAARGDVVGPHPHSVDRRRRRLPGQPQMDQAEQATAVERRRRRLDAVGAQLDVADRVLERQLKVWLWL